MNSRIEERTFVVHYAKVRPPIDSATLWAVREVGRWTLAQHHFLDRKSGDLFMGDGDIKNIESFPKVVRHLAGVGGSPGFSGDGGPAATAQFNGLRNFTFDNDGNILIADQLNHRIRKIDARTRIVTTIAGNGSGVHSGDGGLAIDAGMISPLDVSVDRDGNIYFSDWTANRVRKIDTNGIITTVIGTGQTAFNGLSRTGATTNLAFPTDVEVRPDGSLVFIEFNRNVMREFVPAPQPTAARSGFGPRRPCPPTWRMADKWRANQP